MRRNNEETLLRNDTTQMKYRRQKKKGIPSWTECNDRLLCIQKLDQGTRLCKTQRGVSGGVISRWSGCETAIWFKRTCYTTLSGDVRTVFHFPLLIYRHDYNRY